MQMGFNNDVPYRGLVLHIQTEDHGLATMKVTSHVFRGGQILDSKTVSYANEVADFTDDVARNERIRVFMKGLHRHLYKRIHAGHYDEALGLEPRTAAEGPTVADEPIEIPSEHLESAGFEVVGELEDLGAVYAAKSRGEVLDDFEPQGSDAWLGDAAKPRTDDAIQYADARAFQGIARDNGLADALREALGA